MDCQASNITVFYLNWFSKALTELIRVKYGNITRNFYLANTQCRALIG